MLPDYIHSSIFNWNAWWLKNGFKTNDCTFHPIPRKIDNYVLKKFLTDRFFINQGPSFKFFTDFHFVGSGVHSQATAHSPADQSFTLGGALSWSSWPEEVKKSVSFPSTGKKTRKRNLALQQWLNSLFFEYFLDISNMIKY